MPKGNVTYQMRAEYLARCLGCTLAQLTSGIDAAMARAPQGTAPRAASSGSAAPNSKARKSRRPAAKQPASATS